MIKIRIRKTLILEIKVLNIRKNFSIYVLIYMPHRGVFSKSISLNYTVYYQSVAFCTLLRLV